MANVQIGGYASALPRQPTPRGDRWLGKAEVCGRVTRRDGQWRWDAPGFATVVARARRRWYLARCQSRRHRGGSCYRQ